MKKYFLLFAALCILTGCKPTEQNYKQAYDVAMQKKEQQKISADGSEKDFSSLTGPRKEVVGTDTIYVDNTRVKAVEGETPRGDGKIGVAISRFGMITNARRQAADLSETEKDAFVAVDGDGNYYVVISRNENLTDAAGSMRDFMSRHKEYPYIGLPEAPITVIISD